MEAAIAVVKLWLLASVSYTASISHTGNQSMAPSSCLSQGMNLCGSTGNGSYQCNHSLWGSARESKLRICYGAPEADARDAKPAGAWVGIWLPEITARA